MTAMCKRIAFALLRPVVLFQHYGWDEWGLGWWSEKERDALASTIRDRNVVAVFWGHTHSVQRIDAGGIPTFCSGSGQADPGPGVFLVVKITPREMIIAKRKPEGWGTSSNSLILNILGGLED
jgi:cytolysin (calcineurin-like family phosphatase)